MIMPVKGDLITLDLDGQGEGSLTFECETVPSVDLKVWVEVKGVVDKTPPNN